jgi:hypothetical protein
MHFKWLPALLALFAASPAAADITARYAQAGNEPPMIVQINDRGDSRVTASEAVYLTLDGTTYMLLTDPEGSFVVRQDVFLAVIADLQRVVHPGPLPAAPQVTAIESGTETVGGRSGARFRLAAPNNPADSIDFVISDDPALTPLGRVMAAQLIAFMDALDRQWPGFRGAVAPLLRRGTLLRIGDAMRLDGIDGAPIPATAFAPPAAPIGREALIARLNARRPR